MKVVWLCTFTNYEIQQKLPLWRKRTEMAEWVPNFLKGFRNNDDIEIHVISRHEFLKKSHSFSQGNIHYYFIPFGIPFYHRKWPVKIPLDVITNYYLFNRRVIKLVRRLQPDLVNVIGAEGHINSYSVLHLADEFPFLITIQGFISQLKDSIKRTVILNYRIKNEEKILSKFRYFAGERDSSNYIKTYNPNHEFFKLYFPVNEELINSIESVRKQYDCIYYGRMNKQKGADDFIKVVAEIKKKKQDVKALMVGGGDIAFYRRFAEKKDCLDNIEFTGFLPTQKDVFKQVVRARVLLAPPHFERLSLTIREAMFLKVPIVAYATGGIPYINQDAEHIRLVDTHDYKSMAERVLWLLNNKNERAALAERAYNFAMNEFGRNVNVERNIRAYKTLLNKSNENEL